ncbi:UNVERIFIED_ORG: NSS family neurotransmitter:Na+ symporter [Idiomarina abyssalis]|uniref:Na+-dependent transporter of the SNF family n=1 Tax=Idiomarina loihiensis (strain ATCC BAA-735 / DSM 15497 / L2-TR) TaxID=283942 RepID=Q5QZ24_IDILO|nr:MULTISPECIES: sodium-dependent transporter [Idiomarina]PHQ88960.1 MAG: sodium-dependent transporter [Idiomarina sp.]HAS21924.1 sodium-dependent transporter [Idiomarina loihiensis]AAV82171.1 Na+-dependent transporter of the SNF family [Idiomarina loihiensis L2TR]AGM36201.1 SNF family Na(+)-dependent transporter [Idiomarina loihiensis GSL 199]TDO53603.1 NSS family neurotransmitter:Na+ symporter [Idiomarina sp. 017G]|tara:strand:- start:970 stop:2313 length:1344 start_codon:yes stop_codon:yes gene_type:complete
MANSSPAFATRLGFILAAAGSAVGVGNIWGFPTQAASNGGGAFLLVYLIMIVLLAYPMLVAEITIGRIRRQNPIEALRNLSSKPFLRGSGAIAGVIGLIVLSLILSFYAIVSGWLVSYMLAPLMVLIGQPETALWFTEFSVSRNITTMIFFMLLTVYVVRSGVNNGIERWSRRLMPLLFILLIGMSAYILTQDGAIQGLKMYLLPDFSTITDPNLIIRAMGQAFFSLSLGVCVMMTYGAYLSNSENIPKTAAWVAGIDTSVAFLAGLLILPAMFVAQSNGITIYADDGTLLSADTLVFTVLPAMFDALGYAGLFMSFGFFLLMVIAAITSSISMLEAPVNALREEANCDRSSGVWIIALIVTAISTTIIYNFELLFGAVITFSTVYMQPIMALVFGVMLTWVLRQNYLLKALKQGSPDIDKSLFWKVWPWYVKFICPILILLVIWRG